MGGRAVAIFEAGGASAPFNRPPPCLARGIQRDFPYSISIEGAGLYGWPSGSDLGGGGHGPHRRWPATPRARRRRRAYGHAGAILGPLAADHANLPPDAPARRPGRFRGPPRAPRPPAFKISTAGFSGQRPCRSRYLNAVATNSCCAYPQGRRAPKVVGWLGKYRPATLRGGGWRRENKKKARARRAEGGTGTGRYSSRLTAPRSARAPAA